MVGPEVEEPVASSPSEVDSRVVILLLWLLVFSAASQTMIVAPILPRLGEDLAVRTSLLGTLVSAYSLMVGVFAVSRRFRSSSWPG